VLQGNPIGIGTCSNVSFVGSECENIWEPVNEDKAETCKMYSQLLGWNIAEAWSSLITTIANKTMYASTATTSDATSNSSSEEEYCLAAIFVCQEMTDSSTSCVIGIDPETFSPFSFSGDSFEQIELKDYLQGTEDQAEFWISLIPEKWMLYYLFHWGSSVRFWQLF